MKTITTTSTLTQEQIEIIANDFYTDTQKNKLREGAKGKEIVTISTPCGHLVAQYIITDEYIYLNSTCYDEYGSHSWFSYEREIWSLKEVLEDFVFEDFDEDFFILDKMNIKKEDLIKGLNSCADLYLKELQKEDIEGKDECVISNDSTEFNTIDENDLYNYVQKELSVEQDKEYMLDDFMLYLGYRYVYYDEQSTYYFK